MNRTMTLFAASIVLALAAVACDKTAQEDQDKVNAAQQTATDKITSAQVEANDKIATAQADNIADAVNIRPRPRRVTRPADESLLVCEFRMVRRSG